MSADLSLEKAIRARLAPVLRADGFKGSGKTFRRITNDILCIVNIQASPWGYSFAINLAIHPIVIPAVHKEHKDVQKLLEWECDLRRRLRADDYDQWWNYHDQASLEIAVDDATQMYLDIGRDLFQSQTCQTSPLFNITSKQVVNDGWHQFSDFAFAQVPAARLLSLLRLSAGQYAEAKAFAEIALQSINVKTPLKQDLETLIEHIREREAGAS